MMSHTHKYEKKIPLQKYACCHCATATTVVYKYDVRTEYSHLLTYKIGKGNEVSLMGVLEIITHLYLLICTV